MGLKIINKTQSFGRQTTEYLAVKRRAKTSRVEDTMLDKIPEWVKELLKFLLSMFLESLNKETVTPEIEREKVE